MVFGTGGVGWLGNLARRNEDTLWRRRAAAKRREVIVRLHMKRGLFSNSYRGGVVDSKERVRRGLAGVGKVVVNIVVVDFRRSFRRGVCSLAVGADVTSIL